MKITSENLKNLKNGEIIETPRGTELFLTINPDTIEVRSVYDAYGVYFDREVYKYINDGKYRVEKKECER